MHKDMMESRSMHYPDGKESLRFGSQREDIEESLPTHYPDTQEPLRPDSQQSQPFRKVREMHYSFPLSLRILSAVLSLGITGVLAHVIFLHNTTTDMTIAHPNGMLMTAWPSNMIIFPTYLMLAASAIAATFNITALISSLGIVSPVTRNKRADMF